MAIFNCSFCNYFSDRKYNLNKHITAKHFNVKCEKTHVEKLGENVCPNGENVCPSGENVCPIGENVCPNGENVCPKFFCQKCNKKYKSKRYLNKHESKCKGVDELTCPKCMISFTTRSAKSKHIKANTCKARSIIYAREPNFQNIIQNQTINNIQNNTIQNNTIQNNNLIINNFGCERLDHISHDEIMKMLMSGINTLPMYIEKKHFDKNFPENNNIVYTKENKCKVLEDNCWKEKDINLLSSKLIQDNSQILLLYCDQNEIKITEEIMDEELYARVKNKLFIIYNKSDNEKYNHIINIIKELVKNSYN